MATIRYTIEDALATVLQLNSQRAAAKFIGVNSRTLERWLSGELKPSPPSQQKIRAAATKVRRQLVARAKRENYPSVRSPVPVYGTRRLLSQYDNKGKPTGKQFYSDWINYRVDRLDFEQTLAVLVDLQRHKTLIQFIFFDLWGINSDGSRYSLLDDEPTEKIKLKISGSTHFDMRGQTKRDLSILLRKFFHGDYPKGRSNIQSIAALI